MKGSLERVLFTADRMRWADNGLFVIAFGRGLGRLT